MSLVRATLTRQSGLRFFTTSTRYHKSVTDSIKDAAKSVDQTVANAAVKGIEAAEGAASTVKQTVNSNLPNSTSTSGVVGDASQAAGAASGKVSEALGAAKGKASELSGKMQSEAGGASGEASKVAGQAEGKAEELLGKAKGKVNEVKGKM